MSVTVRKYNHKDDFISVGEFLVDTYQPENGTGNYPQPAWEYIHGHPGFDETTVDRMGIWEDSGRIVGVVHYELALGEAFFEIHPRYTHLKPSMLDYAETNLCGITEDGRRYIRAWINDFDKEFEEMVTSRGYEKPDAPPRPMSRLKIPRPFRSEKSLPDGFRLKSLAENNDLAKLDRILYRGFGHGDEPPAVDYDERYKARMKQQSVPGHRKELNIVVEASDGHFVAISGTWFVAGNKYAYIEPVCTDPDYRRMGLGRAAVMEGIRRCAELGAQVAYVGSEQPFYLAMGFEKIYSCNCWIKYLN